jgi:hypothetical protein
MILPPACPLGILPPDDAAVVSLRPGVRFLGHGGAGVGPARSPGGAVSAAAALPANADFHAAIPTFDA